jgi:hypothetical protein
MAMMGKKKLRGQKATFEKFTCLVLRGAGLVKTFQEVGLMFLVEFSYERNFKRKVVTFYFFP